MGWDYKGNGLIVFVGFVLAVVGQSIRIYSMYTCGFNFTHVIRDTKVEGHKLVTDGIYKYQFFYFVETQ